MRVSDWNELQDLALDAVDAGEVAKIDLLLAIQQGEFDFLEAELNGFFPEVRPMTFEEWLRREVEVGEGEGGGEVEEAGLQEGGEGGGEGEGGNTVGGG